jgi:putative hemin transport protein
VSIRAKREQGLRAKDAAEALQLSEGAVIAAHGGEHERTLQACRCAPNGWTFLKAWKPAAR